MSWKGKTMEENREEFVKRVNLCQYGGHEKVEIHRYLTIDQQFGNKEKMRATRQRSGDCQ